MDPMQQQPSPVDGFASTLSSTNQEVTANQEVKPKPSNRLVRKSSRNSLKAFAENISASSLHRPGHKSNQWLSKSIEQSGRCRATASHLDIIPLKSKLPSARRSTSEWSQVHPVPKSNGSWRLTTNLVSSTLRQRTLRAGLFQTY